MLPGGGVIPQIRSLLMTGPTAKGYIERSGRDFMNAIWKHTQDLFGIGVDNLNVCQMGVRALTNYILAILCRSKYAMVCKPCGLS